MGPLCGIQIYSVGDTDITLSSMAERKRTQTFFLVNVFVVVVVGSIEADGRSWRCVYLFEITYQLYFVEREMDVCFLFLRFDQTEDKKRNNRRVNLVAEIRY